MRPSLPGTGSRPSPPPLDTGRVSEGWLSALAIFAMYSTALAALSAAATRESDSLVLVPLAFGAFGFAGVVAIPADDCCGVCQPFPCLGHAGGSGAIVDAAPADDGLGVCHPVLDGGLAAITAGGLAGGPAFAAGGASWILPAMAATVTDARWATVTAAAALPECSSWWSSSQDYPPDSM